MAKIKQLEDFSNQILKDLNLAQLSEDKKQAVLEKIQTHLQDVMIRVLVRAGNSEQKKRLKDALAGSAQQIENTIAEVASEIPDFGQTLEDALLLEYENL